LQQAAPAAQQSSAQHGLPGAQQALPAPQQSAAFAWAFAAAQQALGGLQQAPPPAQQSSAQHGLPGKQQSLPGEQQLACGAAWVSRAVGAEVVQLVLPRTKAARRVTPGISFANMVTLQ
jgi:hypothetical protein